MTKLIDLTGQRFGRLTVVSRSTNGKRSKTRWNCQCDCGKTIVVYASHLRSGHTTSCGCFHNENVKRVMQKHSMCDSRIYSIWASMKQRVTNFNRKDSKYYSEKGISLCREWEDFGTFYRWAIENGYAEDLTIDRIDGEKGYTPENCRWITQKEQCNNKSNNRIIEYKGESKTVAEWARFYGIAENTIVVRLKRGWNIEKALTTPVHNK